jgi:hypothetical protein
MASFVIQNPPSNLAMFNFRSKIDSLGTLAKQCRFVVRISPTGAQNIMTTIGYNLLLQDLSYLCEATDFPGRGFEVGEARYYGPPILFPFNTKYSNELSMSFLCRAASFERQLFDDWLSVINPTNNFNFNYPEKYQADVDVFLLAENGATNASRDPQAVYLWSLKNAWPVNVNPQAVTWADDGILRLSVSFAYQYWVRPGRDAVPGGAPGSIPGLEEQIANTSGR